jgi:hypothetical protein
MSFPAFLQKNHRETEMPRTAPWHAKRTIYFHDNDQCAEGQKVPPTEREPGTGGKSQCAYCAIQHARETSGNQ